MGQDVKKSMEELGIVVSAESLRSYSDERTEAIVQEKYNMVFTRERFLAKLLRHAEEGEVECTFTVYNLRPHISTALKHKVIADWADELTNLGYLVDIEEQDYNSYFTQFRMIVRWMSEEEYEKIVIQGGRL